MLLSLRHLCTLLAPVVHLRGVAYQIGTLPKPGDRLRH